MCALCKRERKLLKAREIEKGTPTKSNNKQRHDESEKTVQLVHSILTIFMLQYPIFVCASAFYSSFTIINEREEDIPLCTSRLHCIARPSVS